MTSAPLRTGMMTVALMSLRRLVMGVPDVPSGWTFDRTAIRRIRAVEELRTPVRVELPGKKDGLTLGDEFLEVLIAEDTGE